MIRFTLDKFRALFENPIFQPLVEYKMHEICAGCEEDEILESLSRPVIQSLKDVAHNIIHNLQFL